jgi:hypothetical protein
MMTDKVVFRKFKEGDIIALFPRLPGTNSPYTCDSYMHFGQSGSADPEIVKITKPATPEEYADLAKELRSMGFELDIKTRVRYVDMLERERLIKEQDERAANKNGVNND